MTATAGHGSGDPRQPEDHQQPEDHRREDHRREDHGQPGGEGRSAADRSTGRSRKGLAVRCEEVVHIYRTGGSEVVALRGVDLDITAGETVALVGPSGSGKSTLLALMGGLVQPSAGLVFLGDREISRVRPRELLGLRAGSVGTVLQGAGRNLLPYATPALNLSFVRRSVPRSRRNALPEPEELLADLNLQHLAHQPLRTLSAGERQQVAVVAALASAPGLLLADEPTSQLDTAARDAVVDLLLRINRRQGTTIVAVTHDAAVGARLGRVVNIRFGRVGLEGRHGGQFAVIGRDGGLQLPDDLIRDWPPGTRVEVRREGDDLRLSRRSAPEEGR